MYAFNQRRAEVAVRLRYSEYRRPAKSEVVFFPLECHWNAMVFAILQMIYDFLRVQVAGCIRGFLCAHSTKQIVVEGVVIN